MLQLDRKLTGLEGETIEFNGEVATVRSISLFALQFSSQNNYESKIAIAKKIKNTDSNEISLKIEELNTIKRSVDEIVRFSAALRHAFEVAIEEEDE